LGISACLLGEKVRFDGGHKLDRFITEKRWRDTLALGFKPGHLVDFHTRHKLLTMSHSPKHYELLGKLVAQIKGILKDQYYLHPHPIELRLRHHV
jgi:uncharacterized protein YbgA (DUF1722 family)